MLAPLSQRGVREEAWRRLALEVNGGRDLTNSSDLVEGEVPAAVRDGSRRVAWLELHGAMDRGNELLWLKEKESRVRERI